MTDQTTATANSGVDSAGMFPCPYCQKRHYPHQTCVPVQQCGVQPQPVGCICPPGANLQCERPLCPRKPMPSLAARATI